LPESCRSDANAFQYISCGQFTVRYSTQFYKFVETGENLIRPDREVIPSWTDFKSGRDPVLEWVLAQHNY